MRKFRFKGVTYRFTDIGAGVQRFHPPKDGKKGYWRKLSYTQSMALRVKLVQAGH